MKIANKLSVIIIGLVILMIASGVIGVINTHKVAQSADILLGKAKVINSLQEVRVSFQQLIMPANDYLIHGNKEEIGNFEKLLITAKEKLADYQKVLSKHHHLTGLEYTEKAYLQDVEKKLAQIEKLARDIFKIAVPLKENEGALKTEEMDAFADEVTKGLNQFLEKAKADMSAAIKIAQTIRVTSQIIALAFILIFISSGLLLGSLLSRPIIKAIGQLVSGTKELANGKLGFQVKVNTKDELFDLAFSFNKMSSDLQNNQEEIQTQNEELNTSNEELKSSNEEIATTNEELRVATEELRQTNEELVKLKTELEKKVEERTRETTEAKQALEKKVVDLERFNKLSVGRELAMKELKERISQLEQKLKEKS